MIVALIISSSNNRYYVITALPVDPANGHNGVLRCECLGYTNNRKCKHISALLGEKTTVHRNYVKWTTAGKKLFKQANSILVLNGK